MPPEIFDEPSRDIVELRPTPCNWHTKSYTVDEIKTTVLDCLKMGMPAGGAAKRARISLARLAQLRTADPEFDTDCEEAIAFYMQFLVGCVNQGAVKDWHAAAWGLERGFPQLFGRRDTVAIVNKLETYDDATLWELVQRATSTVTGGVADSVPDPPTTGGAEAAGSDGCETVARE